MKKLSVYLLKENVILDLEEVLKSSSNGLILWKFKCLAQKMTLVIEMSVSARVKLYPHNILPFM